MYNANGSTAHRNVIRNNTTFDNARLGLRGPGIILSSGDDNLAYNNRVWGNTISICIVSRRTDKGPLCRLPSGHQVSTLSNVARHKSGLLFGDVSSQTSWGERTSAHALLGMRHVRVAVSHG